MFSVKFYVLYYFSEFYFLRILARICLSQSFYVPVQKILTPPTNYHSLSLSLSQQQQSDVGTNPVGNLRIGSQYLIRFKIELKEGSQNDF